MTHTFDSICKMLDEIKPWFYPTNLAVWLKIDRNEAALMWPDMEDTKGWIKLATLSKKPDIPHHRWILMKLNKKGDNMKSSVIYADKYIQIIGYDDDNGKRGNTFSVCENAIDHETGGQLELLHVKLDRNFFACIEDVKGALKSAVEDSIYIIKHRHERGKISLIQKEVK